MNAHRGVVLRLNDAAAIHRWLEFLMDDRRFFNPIEAFETKKAAEAAKARLEAKLIAMFQEPCALTGSTEPTPPKA